MPLKETREELYKPESKIGEERKYESPFEPEKAQEEGRKVFAGKEKWEKPSDTMFSERKKAIKYGSMILGGVVLLALLIVGVVRFKQSSFVEDRVNVAIEGSQSVRGADLVGYKITVKNDNRVDLREAEIILNHSMNFKVESSDVEFQKQGDNNTLFKIGEIESHSEKTINLSGRFYAPKDFIVYLKPTVRFIPSNFSSVFERSSVVGVNVNSAPIALNVSATGEILNNGLIEYFIDYKNESDVNFSNVRIEAEYPDGFDFSESDKAPFMGDNVWNIDNLSPGQAGSIKILGTLSGAEGDRRVVRVSLGVVNGDNKFVLYNKREDVTRVVASPLFVSVLLEKSRDVNVNLGDLISCSLQYKNNGTRGFRNAIITFKLDSPIIDLENLNLINGHYDGTSKVITWKAADIPGLANLAPGDSGAISFLLPVKKFIDVKKEEDKNYSLGSYARIESSDIIYGTVGKVEGFSEKVTAKLNSDLQLSTRAYYKDAFMQNSGPIPPRVGQETTYTVHWTVKNLSNELSGAVVRSFLPTGVRWKGEVYPGGENVRFNERTNEVIWEAGNVDNGVGYFGAAREVRFKVSIVPEVNQTGNSVDLLQNSFLEAKDLYTEANLSSKTEKITTNLSEEDTETMDVEGYSIVKQ